MLPNFLVKLDNEETFLENKIYEAFKEQHAEIRSNSFHDS